MIKAIIIAALVYTNAAFAVNCESRLASNDDREEIASILNAIYTEAQDLVAKKGVNYVDAKTGTSANELFMRMITLGARLSYTDQNLEELNKELIAIQTIVADLQPRQFANGSKAAIETRMFEEDWSELAQPGEPAQPIQFQWPNDEYQDPDERPWDRNTRRPAP